MPCPGRRSREQRPPVKLLSFRKFHFGQNHIGTTWSWVYMNSGLISSQLPHHSICKMEIFGNISPLKYFGSADFRKKRMPLLVSAQHIENAMAIRMPLETYSTCTFTQIRPTIYYFCPSLNLHRWFWKSEKMLRVKREDAVRKHLPSVHKKIALECLE